MREAHQQAGILGRVGQIMEPGTARLMPDALVIGIKIEIRALCLIMAGHTNFYDLAAFAIRRETRCGGRR